MKNSFKKLTAWLCCMAMLISFIPAAALPAFAATGTGVTTVGSTTFRNPGSYYLTKDITATAKSTLAAGEYTLDFNGYTLTSAVASRLPIFTLSNATTMTLTGEGGLKSTLTTKPLVSVENASAVLNVNGGTFTGGSSSFDMSAGKIVFSGDPVVELVTATGGTVEFKNLTAGASIKLADGITPVNDGTAYLNTETGAYEYKEPDAVKYDINAYIVNDDTVGTIAVTVDGRAATEAAAGKTVTVTATPNGGYLLDTIKVNSEAISGNTFTMPAEAVDVAVAFKADTTEYTVTVTQPAKGGTVSVSPAKGTYGTLATVTATPTADTTFQLKEILVDGNAISGNTFNIVGNHTVTATFVDPYAAEQLPTTGGALAEGNYALLDGSKNLATGVTISGDVTIDLNGNTLTGAAAPYFTINAGGKLTIKDSVGGGKVQGLASAANSMIVVNANGAFELVSGKLTGNTTADGGAITSEGAVTVSGGEISGNTATAGAGAIYAKGGTVTVSGGVISGTAATYGGAIYALNKGVVINISGGTITGTANKGGAISSQEAWVDTNRVTLNVSGGTIGGTATTAQSGAIGGYSMDATFTGGTIDGMVWLRHAKTEISGGTFTTINVRPDSGASSYLEITGKPVISSLVIDQTINNSAGTHTMDHTTIGGLVPGASVTTTANDALTIVENDTTVAHEAGTKVYTYAYQSHTITKNVSGGELGTVELSADSAKMNTVITITATPNAPEYTVKVTVTDAEGNPITVTGNKFTMPDCAVTVTVEFAELDETQAFVNLTTPAEECGTVTISVATGEVIAAGQPATIYTEPATGYTIKVTLDGEEVDLIDGQYAFTVEGAKVYNFVAIAEKINYNLTLTYGEGNVEGGTATLSKTTANYGDDITVTADAGYDLVSVLVNGEAIEGNTFTMPAKDTTVTVITAVHVLADKGNLELTKGSLEEGKYTLADHLTLTGVLNVTNAEVVIDLAGYTITAGEGGGVFALNDANSKLTIIDSVGGGQIVSGASEGTPAISIQAGTFTLEAGEITGWNREGGAGGMVFLGADAIFNMKGGKLTGATAQYGPAIRANGIGAVVNISGGEISGNTATGQGVIHLAGCTTLNMTGGTVTNNTAAKGAFELYATRNISGATLNISGGTITGNTSTEGGAIYNDNGTVNISGGTFTGNSASAQGGVIIILKGSTTTITGGTFTGNSAVRGGVVGTGENVLTAGRPELTIGGTAVIENNTCTEYGGNIYAYTANITIEGGKIGKSFKGEADGGKGSGNVWLRGNNATVLDSTLTITGGDIYGIQATNYTTNISGNPVIGELNVSPAAATMSNLGTAAKIHTAGVGMVTIPEGDDTVFSANDRDFTYNFKPHAITVNVNDAAMGTASADKTEAKMGDEVTITAEAEIGYAKTDIVVVDAEGNPVPVNGDTFIMPDCAVTVTVEFAELDETQAFVNLTTPAEEYGTVTISVATGEVIAAGQPATIYTEPATGYTIKVTLDGEEVDLINGQYAFTVEGAKVYNFVATAEKIDYALTLTYGEGNVEGGTATLSKDTANYGDVITVTAAKGFDLVSVLVNGEAIEGNTFTMPAQNTTVTVITAVHVLPEYAGLNGVTQGELPEGIYTLTENVTLTGVLTIYKEVVIDLNGYSITTAGNGGIFGLYEAADLTVMDSSAEQTGKLISCANTGTPAVYINGGSFTLNGGTITGWSRPDGAGGAVFLAANTTFIMNGGTITGNTGKDRAAIRADGGGHYVEFNGGQIIGNTTENGPAVRILGVAADAEKGVEANPSTVVITGGEISGNEAGEGIANVWFDACNVTISGDPVIESLTLYSGSRVAIGGLTEGASVTATTLNALTITDGRESVYTADGYTYVYAPTFEAAVNKAAIANGEVELSVQADNAYYADVKVCAPANEKVYFYAKAADGYRLKNLWLVDGNNTVETEVNLTEGWFKMPAVDVKVLAEFETIPSDKAIVKVETAENGALIVDKVGTIEANEVVTITAQPALGYAVSKVTVNGEKLSAVDGAYSFTAEGGVNYTIAAEFTRATYTITAHETVAGTAAASVKVAKIGDTFTIKAALDYKLVSAKVYYMDGETEVEILANTDGSYTMPAADVIFTVVTEEKSAELPDGGALTTGGEVAEGKYVLTGKHTLTKALVIKGRVIIDLAGNTMQMAPAMTGGAFTISGRLTIMDSVGGGKVQFKSMTASGGISIAAGGEFVLEGGELTGWSRRNADGVYEAGGFIDMFNNSTFRMTGGKITGVAASGQTVIRCHEAATGGHKVEITGGEITGNNAVSGDIIRMEGAESNRATMIIGGQAVINGNTLDGEPFTYANYEIQGTYTDFVIEGNATVGVIAPGNKSTVTVKGAPKIDALRAALNADGTLKEAASITLGELTEGAFVITGGGLDLSKVGNKLEGVSAAYWNNQDKGTQYQGYIYVPEIKAEYNQPLSSIDLPWTNMDANFTTVGESVYKVNVNGTKAEMMVNVEPQVIDLTKVEVNPYFYTGEQIKPELVLKDKYGNEIPAEEISAAYGANVEVGAGTIAYTNAAGNYVFEGEVTFEIVKGVTDLGYPEGTMMVAIKPNTATTGNKVQLTLPNKPGEVKVTCGEENEFVKNISYANGIVTFDTEAKPFGTESKFDVVVETNNYETAKLVVVVKSFEKTEPTNLTATYGDTLADVALKEGWRWADPTQSVGNVGVEKEFAAYFSNETTTTPVKVTVNPKAVEIVYSLTNDTEIVFDGTAKTPAVTVAVKDGAVISADQYTVAYSNNVDAGTASYTITSNGNYEFTNSTIGTFTILKASLGRLTVTRGFSASNAATAIVDMGAMLPENRGATTYKVDEFGSNAIASADVDENGEVTFVTKVTNKTDTAVIKVTAVTANYGEVKLTITVNLTAAVSGDGPVVGGGGGGGGFGGGGGGAAGGDSGETTEPSDSGANVEIDTDGNKITTTEDSKTGLKTVVVEATNGVTATTTSDLYGRYETTVVIPSSAVTGSGPVVLPVEGKGQAKIEVPGMVEVEFPVENITPGTIAVIVNADGTEELIKDAKLGEDGMIMILSENCTVKVYDNAKHFNDLSGHWSSNAVAFVTARGMFAGTGNGSTFSPEVKMTRAMLAQVIYNLEGAEEHGHDAGFADIGSDAWYSKAVNWAAREGIVSGYSNGTYQPDKELTREEVVQIFFNYAKSKGYDTSYSADLSTFADGHNVSDWAQTAKQWGVGAGLISGKGGNILDAKGGATRAEGAQMFMNFCQNIVE